MPLLQRNHSHTIPYCDIRLDEDVIVLRGPPSESAGALLKGKLAFCLTEQIPVRGITLTLVGMKRLHWQERMSTVTGITMKTVKHEELVYEKKWQFLEFDHKHAVTLRPDNYEYEFDVALPGDLPESIEGLENAHIFYRLKAVIDRPRFSQNIVAKKHVRVVRTLNAGALELSQTMSVENLWPNKVEYSISIPNKAVVFGSSIPVDIVLIPLLKGLSVGKVTCSLKELHNFSIPHKESTRSDMRSIITQTFEGGDMVQEPHEDEDFGRWNLHQRVELPRTLARCVQDCEVESIKVRHKLKFTIQLHNPDGHTSELRASLPVMLFISPNLLMAEDNVIHDNSSMEDSEDIHGAYAPPRYDDHYLDRLYEGIPHDRFETPLPSGANTPAVLSRSNSHENLGALSMMDSGRISGTASPLRIPDAGSGRWSVNRSRVTTPGFSSPPTVAGGFSDAELVARLSGHHQSGDYFSSRTGRSTTSGPSTRSHSPEDHSRGEEEELDLNELSKVPSYTTAVRQGIRNLSTRSNLPQYEDGTRSNPESTTNTPRHSPPTSYTMPVVNTGRGGHEGRGSRLWGRSLTANDVHNTVETNVGHGHGHGFTGGLSGISAGLADAERRIRLLQLRGR